MFQLTYTSCRPGVSLNGSGGYTVRAASRGIDPRWPTQAPQLARYDMTSTSHRSESVRLAFHHKDGAAIVTHTVHTIDHEMRVASFTHALIDPTGHLGPSDAIAAWNGPFWRRANDDDSPELPTVEILPAGETLTWASLERRLGQPAFRAMACVAMSAWLRSPERPIVLLADNDAVAAVIWILTHALPASLLKHFTFATHDHDPATASVSLVGYHSLARGLPTAAMSAWCWFNAATGTHSDEPTEAYAEFVVLQAAAGCGNTVDSFVAQSEELGVESADQMSLLYRVVHESYVCTEADLLSLQCCSKLLRWLLQDPRHAQVAIGLVGRLQMTDPQAGPGLAAVFRENPGRVDALVANLLSRAAEAIHAGNDHVALSCIDLCTRAAPQLGAASLWRRLIEQSDCTTMPTEMRGWLAARIRGMDGATDTEMLIERLLSLRSESLPQLLSLPIDGALKVEACRLAIDRHGSLPLPTLEVLCHQPDVLGSLLRIAKDPMAVALSIVACDPAVAINLSLSNEPLRRQLDIDAVVAQAAERSTVWIDHLLAPTLSQHWPALLAGSHGRRIVSQVMGASLTQYSPVEIGRFLRAARGIIQLPRTLAEPLERRLQLVDVLSDPTSAIADVSTITAAVGDLPDADRQSVFLLILPRLVASVTRTTGSAICNQVDILMDAVATHEAESPARTLRKLAIAARDADRLLKEPQLAVTLLAHAFGAAGAKEPSNGAFRDELVDLGVEVMALYARAGGPALNRAVRDQASRWPEPARSLCRLASRGQRINGRLRAFLARRGAKLER